MSLEIELKYNLDGVALDRVETHPLLNPRQKESTAIFETTYYDSPDYTLRQSGLALRVRIQNNHCYQTLKARGKQEHIGLSAREEWEWPIETSTPDLSLIPSELLPQTQSLDRLRQQLRPLFLTHFERRQWLIQLEESTLIEVAFDKGIIKTDHAKMPLHELELELKSGKVERLVKLGQLLSESLKLTPELRSKAGRGFELLSGVSP